MGEFLGERFLWKAPFFENEENGTVPFSTGMW